MDARCHIELLGGLRVQQGERIITRFRTQKAAGLLAYLAYHLGRTHPREVLVELLWPDSAPDAGRTNLRVELSSLRRQLEPPGVSKGDILQTDRVSVQLNENAVTTDVGGFEALLRSAEQASSEVERIQLLTDAVGLYRGPLLPGHYHDWIFPEQERLADAYFRAVWTLTKVLEDTGDLDAALDYARRAATMDPLREEAHRELIRLLLAAGEPEAALRQYHELARILDQELAESPSAVTRRLVEWAPEDGGQRELPPVADAVPGRSAGVSPDQSPPTGTVTFLLTDIEGSTRLAQRAEEAYTEALETHHTLMRRSFAEHGGHEAKELGDGFIVAFERAADALACAVDIQRALTGEQWPEATGPILVRMALYTGDVELRARDYRGLALHQGARLLTAGHGGQILCSEVTAGLVRRNLGPDLELADLGSYRLRDVEAPERLCQVNYPGMPREAFPPLNAEPSYGSQLPPSFTRFIGREQELRRLEATLLGEAVRLVTVTGPGGAGKSRLALEVARRLLQELRGAVWFVPLHDVANGALLPGAIADALGLPRSTHTNPLDQAVEVLSRQPSLLVLDNLEQLVETAAPAIQQLLGRAPSAKAVVTSRQCLNLTGEVEFTLAPLAVPTEDLRLEALAECESVQLFVDRAQAARPDFQITERNASAVAELCQRLDGIPLAIELAAARSQVLTPAQMLAQLENRFQFLVSRKRDVTERHRTLRAAIDWSYQLLESGLQRFLARLSAFRGGWTAEAAGAVCGEDDVFGALLDLCEHSLVSSAEHGGQMRYSMLESIRDFASEQLGEEAPVTLRDTHAQYFLAFAQQRAGAADGPDEAHAFAEIETELGNMRAAMDWAVSIDEHRLLAGLTAALCDFLWRRGYWQEHMERVQAGLSAAKTVSPLDAALVGKLLHSRARVAYDRGEIAAAEEMCREGLELAVSNGLPKWHARFLNLLALVMRREGHTDQAQEALEDSLHLFRGAKDLRGEGMALHNLGVLAYASGEVDKARELYDRALEAREEAEDLRGAAETQNNLALLAEEAGQFDVAEGAYREALGALLAVGDVLGMAVALCNLGEIALRTDRHDEAVEPLRAAEHTLRHLGSRYADHASECLKKATSEAPQAPEAHHLPWRQALFTAAERVLKS